MKVLITSGTGKVGSELRQRILDRGHIPVVMGHNQEKLENLPSEIMGVYGDFDDEKSWEGVFEGVNKLCLITPTIEGEEEKGVAFIKAAINKGIEHIVFLSVHNAEAGAHIPHFKSKITMETALKESGIPYTFIRANNFFQNDLWFINDVREHNMYTQPLGSVGLNRVDVRDIADAMATSLIDSHHHFKAYPLVGLENLTGNRVAKIYSEVTGMDIIYPEKCLDIWEAKFKSLLPSWQLRDWKIMFEFFLEKGLIACEDDFILQGQILDRSPRSYRNYVLELWERTLSESSVDDVIENKETFQGPSEAGQEF